MYSFLPFSFKYYQKSSTIFSGLIFIVTTHLRLNNNLRRDLSVLQICWIMSHTFSSTINNFGFSWKDKAGKKPIPPFCHKPCRPCHCFITPNFTLACSWLQCSTHGKGNRATLCNQCLRILSRTSTQASNKDIDPKWSDSVVAPIQLALSPPSLIESSDDGKRILQNSVGVLVGGKQRCALYWTC